MIVTTIKYLRFISKILCSYLVQNRKFKLNIFYCKIDVSFEAEIEYKIFDNFEKYDCDVINDDFFKPEV